jgi:hypothetical protein
MTPFFAPLSPRTQHAGLTLVGGLPEEWEFSTISYRPAQQTIAAIAI